jgi:MoxR-like ATPase
MEWRYRTPKMSVNIDETTTATKLGGGYSPMSFASKKKVVHYGTISRCLLRRGLRNKKGELIGIGANLLLDELNRTDFENISFLMGFFESPYRYYLDVEGRPFLNPNHRSEFNFEYRWLCFATMNIQDIGNQPLSLAFKSRFHIIEIEYRKEDVEEILNNLFRFSTYEKRIFSQLYNQVNSWKSANEIRFPAGIRHYNKFFKLLRNGLRKVTTEDTMISQEGLIIRNTTLTLSQHILGILKSAIMMPIIDENRAGLLQAKKDNLESLSKEFTGYIISYLNDKVDEYKQQGVNTKLAIELAFDKLEIINY